MRLGFDLHGAVPGIYEILRQRVAAWRRYGMSCDCFLQKQTAGSITSSGNLLKIK